MMRQMPRRLAAIVLAVAALVATCGAGEFSAVEHQRRTISQRQARRTQVTSSFFHLFMMSSSSRLQTPSAALFLACTPHRLLRLDQSLRRLGESGCQLHGSLEF